METIIILNETKSYYFFGINNIQNLQRVLTKRYKWVTKN